ncbi:exonuclease domain-containing protein [Lacticaseibacillus pabuli]|uniref:3'-5' exonuclease DinG n=1 Tax=Lacticaseibacillus pabuli TaxID=3025672 RepID=A0ABY7WMT3_9LACO|nr:helicase C-terminal domain-containing protein [Lacticaseibacillus sp. KACC 23028]WDF81513.1 exonuclease domain-containing protein [Lacticaseibacillus sp. KACC 23028]
MNESTVYAVIDLETTGPDAGAGDRIIQFGCALVKDHQIIQTFSQLINPDRTIPEPIQQLTGITPDMLTSAPYFDEVAPMLGGMLAGKVIVAHNINFDYPFLSKELVASGQPPLTNKGIDTVQLAQIIMPTEQSYRLSDLTRKLNIKHDNPHRADSDAISTASILMYLGDTFKKLPGPTQRLVAEHSDFLIRDTEQLLKKIASQAPKLSGRYIQVENLTLRSPQKPGKANPNAAEFPYADKDKRRKLKKVKLRFRYAQAKMMNKIYDNAKTDQHPLFIEAGTGLGKSLGYMLPYAYLATPQKKLVVATSTTVLQDQLAGRTANQLTGLLGAKPRLAVLKSPRHLIDLAKFAATLTQGHLNKADRMLQLRIIVWLSQTQTGDLDELHLSSLQTPLLALIRHTGNCGTPDSNPFYDYDFDVRLQKAAQDAAIIVTNHAYLIHHFEDAAFKNQPFLVVDEAQNFPDSAVAGFEVKLDLTRIRRGLQQLSTLIRRAESGGLAEIYSDDQMMSYQLSSILKPTLDSLAKTQSLQQYLASRYVFPNSTQGEYPLSQDELDEVLVSSHADLEIIWRTLQQVLQVADKIRADYLRRRNRFTDSDARVFQQLDEITSSLRDCLPALTAVKDRSPQLLNASLRMVYVQMRHKSDVSSLVLRWRVIQVQDQIQHLLNRFTAPVFTSATLTVKKTADFLIKQLGYAAIPDDDQLRLRSPFKYRNLARIMIAKDAPEPPKQGSARYNAFLAASIAQIASGKHQTLVLFNSLATIAGVYDELAQSPFAGDREILAQGVTGSAAKIARRFAAGDNIVLLGAASFFEGIDYPAKQLECIILTRLPFTAPQEELAVARAGVIERAGGDPFRDDVLPRATLRLRQAFGRLIRTENDRGVFVVLDPRFTKTEYGRSMQKALPNVDTDLLPVAAMPAMIEGWLASDNEEENDSGKTNKATN